MIIFDSDFFDDSCDNKKLPFSKSAMKLLENESGDYYEYVKNIAIKEGNIAGLDYLEEIEHP